MKLLKPFLLMMLFVIVLAGCNEHREITNVPRDGFINMDGYRLYSRVSGKGKPTIILMSGLAGSTADWAEAEKLFATEGTVLNYDREGIGESTWAGKSKDSKTIAAELHHLLQMRKLPPPYLLVAHSLGSIHARVFAAMYPTEVMGLLLVDPTPEDLIETLLKFIPEEEREFIREQLRLEFEAGLAAMPEGGAKEEVKSIETSYSQVRSMSVTLPVPVAIVSSMKIEEGDNEWSKGTAVELREGLLHELAGGRRAHIVTTDAGHFIQKEKPELLLEVLRWTLEKK